MDPTETNLTLPPLLLSPSSPTSGKVMLHFLIIFLNSIAIVIDEIMILSFSRRKAFGITVTIICLKHLAQLVRPNEALVQHFSQFLATGVVDSYYESCEIRIKLMRSYYDTVC